MTTFATRIGTEGDTPQGVALAESVSFRRSYQNHISPQFASRPHRFAIRSRVPTEALPEARASIPALQALSAALDAKDAYTAGHSERVSMYAKAIARQLDLSEARVADIGLAGELHDIGKIGVPEHLLHKPGPLTFEEYRLVMSHTTIGARILAPLFPRDSTVVSVVRSHHERINGTGGPDGIGGEEIPLPARIVAVADSFDAMTSTRTYRSPLPLHLAVRELQENAGTQFDASCVEAFREVVVPCLGPQRMAG